MLNKVMIIGRLGRDPELRYTQSGAPVATLNVATDESYTDREGNSIFHFDFYRIKKLDEVYDMGYEDYFYGGSLCLLEWPELIEDILPEEALKVTITEEADGSRKLKW